MTRKVQQVVPAVETVEGGGFVVRRPFPTQALDHFDPFLLFDHFGPVEYGPGEAVGAPAHPHRGFETVTYILEGRNTHKDSRGNSGRLGPGDVQWMTAGAGVIHSELPDEQMLRDGGRAHGFQLWVNLPARDKMMAPRYQDVPAARIPRASEGGVAVRVIAGEALGAKAVIEVRTPIFYLHFTLQPGAKHVQPVGADYNTFAYVFSGKGAFGPDEREAREGELVLFERDGSGVEVQARGDEPLEMLLVGGVPLEEPVVRYGPFVMNTKEEIQQAFLDYRSGRMGAIDF